MRYVTKPQGYISQEANVPYDGIAGTDTLLVIAPYGHMVAGFTSVDPRQDYTDADAQSVCDWLNESAEWDSALYYYTIGDDWAPAKPNTSEHVTCAYPDDIMGAFFAYVEPWNGYACHALDYSQDDYYSLNELNLNAHQRRTLFAVLSSWEDSFDA